MALLPAGLLEKIRGRGERVGGVVDDVAASVAVAVDSGAEKVEGMNCVWPKAPAHEPLKSRGSMSPDCTIFIAARSSPR